MASLPQRTDVLIVGAGPTGLTAALALHKQGCKDILVVDSVLAGENSSRAITLHAATMEALEEVGCAEPLIKEGIKTSGGKLWDGYRFHKMADFSALAPYTKFPFLLLIPQHTTERILGERVQEEGIDVRRPFKVVDLRANESDTNITDVVFEDGQVVQARYVVGADGARSIVRQCAGIHYADPDGENGTNEYLKQAVIADITFTSSPPVKRTEVFFVLTNGNFFICLPLPPSSYDGQEVWRIATGIPIGVPPHAPSTEYLQGIIDAYGPGAIPTSALPSHTPPKIKKTIWSTRFRTHSAIADTCFARLAGGFAGPVALIGDAAHLHPPTGGQGMNLGLRDAVFLAPVLIEHLKRSKRATSPKERTVIDEPFKKWAAFRHAQALKVIRIAKQTLSVASYKDECVWYYGIIPVNWVRVRNFILWLANVTGYTRRMNPWRLSGLGSR